MNSARWFIRREDDEPPRTPSDSPFRRFIVRCVRCASYRVKVTSEFDESAGELRVIMLCQKCRTAETLAIR